MSSVCKSSISSIHVCVYVCLCVCVCIFVCGFRLFLFQLFSITHKTYVKSSKQGRIHKYKFKEKENNLNATVKEI